MSVTTNGLTLELVDFFEFDTNIPSANKPSGPLVNISDVEGGNATPYKITVLAYLPSGNTLNPVENTSGLPLQGNEIYLNYYGIQPVEILNKQGGTDTIECRDFQVEFNCDETATEYDLYYVQFTYKIEDSSSADAVLVRDTDEDPRTDRGTVTTPIKNG